MASLTTLTKSWKICGMNVNRLLTVGNIRLMSCYKPCRLVEPIKQSACKLGKRVIKKKPKVAKPEFKSMWRNPRCCNPDPCREICPRYDHLYYESSDKADRVYTRTWDECPLKRIVRKKTCCLDDIKPPPMKRRPRGCRPKTACNPEHDEDEDAECPRVRCPTIRLPCCRKSRIPPSCKKPLPKPSKCKKLRVPFPSYSECKRDEPSPLQPGECTCWILPPACEMYAMEMKKKKKVFE